MNIFLTGATGYIGSHLVPLLIARKHTVRCLVRNPARATALAAQGAELVPGGLEDVPALRKAMSGSDAVFHLAGVYELGPQNAREQYRVNVIGARNVLETAAEIGVLRILHTSTVGVFGNTRGKVVDENYRAPKEALGSEYERTKWAAHYNVAVPLQEKGAPVLILMPGGVTGPGDTSPHASIYEFFFSGMPVLFGANSGITLAHVDDVAEGHVLALEKGRPGESYVLAGPPLTYRQVAEQLGAASGRRVPSFWLPAEVTGVTAAIASRLEGLGVPLPYPSDMLTSVSNYTFWASADKAKRDLGWQPRPQEDLFREIVADRLRG